MPYLIAASVVVGLWVQWELVRSAVAHGTADAKGKSRCVLKALAWIAIGGIVSSAFANMLPF